MSRKSLKITGDDRSRKLGDVQLLVPTPPAVVWCVLKFEAPCRSPWRRSKITGSLGMPGPDPREHMGKTGLDRVNMSKVATFELFASDQAS